MSAEEPLLISEGTALPPDATLAGYFREHNRPPAFSGWDGEPYSLSLESEKTPDLAAPYEGYLVFLRWAQGGLGVAGHLETPTLCRGRTQDEALKKMGELTLREVKGLLDEAITRRLVRLRDRAVDPEDSTGSSEERG